MIRTGIKAHSPEWYAARKELFGSSEVADLLRAGYIDTKLHRTEAAQAAAYEANRNMVLMRKAGLAEDWPGSETTDVGNDFEPGFIALAKRKWGMVLVPCQELLIDSECPRLGCTPDFYVDTPWGRALVQSKMTTAQAQEDCKAGKNGEPSQATYASGPPLRYCLQKMAEMTVTGFEWNALLVLHCANGAFKGRLYPVRRNEAVVRRIRAEARRAWEEVEALRAGERRAVGL